jgi:hypothetical protein
MQRRHDEYIGRAIRVAQAVGINLSEDVDTLDQSQFRRSLPATFGFELINVVTRPDEDSMDRRRQVAQAVERFDQQRRSLVGRQPADEEQQRGRLQAQAFVQGTNGRAGSKEISVDDVAERSDALVGKAGRLSQFCASERAMGHRQIGAPDQAALPATLFERLAVGAVPEVRRRDAVIVQDDAGLAAGQQRQEVQQRIELAVVRDEQVGGGEVGPGVRVDGVAGCPLTVRPDDRMYLPVVLDEDADLGPGFRQKGNLLRQLLAEGVAGQGVSAEQRDPHG